MPTFDTDTFLPPGFDPSMYADQATKPTPETDMVLSGLLEQAAAKKQDRISKQAAEFNALLPELVSSNPEQAHQSSQELFGRVGLLVPELHEFAASGVDFTHLEAKHNIFESFGLAPRLIFTPWLETDQWKNLFASMQADPNIELINAESQDDGLYLSPDVTKEWPRLEDHLKATRANTLTSPDGTDWHVDLVATTNQPTVVNIDHDGNTQSGGSLVPHPELTKWLKSLKLDKEHPSAEHSLSLNNRHPNIASYITTQGLLLADNQQPMDSKTWTWLDGTIQSGSSAPGGYWYPDRGQVLVSWNVVGDRYGNLGWRPAVWG